MLVKEALNKINNFEKNEDNRGYKYEIEITGKHEVRIVDKETGDLYTATFEKSDGSYKMTCSVDRIIKKEITRIVYTNNYCAAL